MKILAVVAGMLLLAGCTGGIRQPDPPSDLIGRDSMVMVLREIVVLESYMQTRYQSVHIYHKAMSASGKKCLKKYRISPDRFERSYGYYVSHQQELQSIYTEVLDSLTKEAAQIGVQATTQRDTTQNIGF
jgi:hypothetical protein